MKSFSRAIIFIILILFTAALVSCSGDGVLFRVEANGGPAVDEQLLPEGVAPRLPSRYSREGYDFVGWYLDDGVWQEPYFGEAVTENTTVYARWKQQTVEISFALNGGTAADGSTGTLRYEMLAGETITPPEVTNGDKEFGGWYADNSYYSEWTGGVAFTDTRIYARWITPNKVIEGDFVLPHVFVNTDGGQAVLSTSTYVPSSVTVVASIGDDVQYEFNEVSAGIRGRGNSTWGFEKKPYRVKFDKKRDLFGMGEAKDWVFLANYIDISLMRNYVMFEMAAALGDKYTSGCKWAHFYLNGEYQGVYLICEQVESGKNRVDVEWDKDTGAPENPADVGYLVEFGNTDTGDHKAFYVGGVSYKGRTRQLSGGVGAIKFPDGDECTDEMVNYIAAYVSQVNEAIFKRNWEKITELCDVDTFVTNFIVSEYLLSNDMGWVFFFYKEPGGKLCLGPLWDFDQAAGVSEHGGATCEGWASGTAHEWFLTLIEMDEFRKLVIQKWTENYDYLHGVPALLDAAAEEYAADIAQNYVRWPYHIGFPHWRSLPEMDDIDTYEGHVEYLKDWFERRMSWIENELGIT